ncbi:MAG: DegV family protein [Dehalococcoidia bacterium]
MSIAIVTDSTACIPPELADRYDIEIVPLHIIFEGRTFVDSLAADTSEFYALLGRPGALPTTAAPSPGMFLRAIGRAAARAETVLCITVSRQFSAMYDAARQAIEKAKAESPRTDVRLVDSRNAAMAQGFVVLEAARAAAGGADIDAVMARAEEMTGRVSLLAMLDTLTYLARGGRVPRVAAWAAGMLQVKPIVRFGAEGIRLVARTRTRRRALEQLARELASACEGRGVHLAVHHANAPDDAAFLLAAAQERLRLEEAYVTEFTQVMGVHTGPGLVGYAYWVE